MRIKKIELVGFKSFKDRTVIHFDAGITGIVGPNGCGKSNIVDALLWVMGEMSAKDLRGSTMTDVIFAGADGYAPAGMAEVSLVLENDGGLFPAQYMKHSEIMVTRCLHRNGESEYFINKELARLRDIQEIFMDTGAGSKGFSIIQQGTIGRIITSKPEDRRNLIEEAAGITKFKARKRESQRKLQATEQNLVRLQDILGELKKQLESLHRQAQKAERYRQIRSEIERWDLWSSARQLKGFRDSSLEMETLFEEIQNQDLQETTILRQSIAHMEKLQLSLLEEEKRVQELQTQHFEARTQAQKREMEIQELRLRIEQAHRSEEMRGSLLQEHLARQEGLAREAGELEAQVLSLRETVGELKSLYEAQNEHFQEVQSRIQEVDESLSLRRRDLFALGQGESAIEAKYGALRSQMSDLEERRSQEEMVLRDLKEKQVQYEQRLKDLDSVHIKELELQKAKADEYSMGESKKSGKLSELKGARLSLDEAKDQWNQVASRLYGLENLQNQFEGFDEGVKAVLLWQKNQGIEGSARQWQPLSQVVEVEEKYELAMASALGPRLQMFLTQAPEKRAERVLALINYLRGEKDEDDEDVAGEGSGKPASENGSDKKIGGLGRAIFAMASPNESGELGGPGGFLSGRDMDSGVSERVPGFLTRLSDVVRVQVEAHRPFVRSLLDKILVVENLEPLLVGREEGEGQDSESLKKSELFNEYTFVTPQGDLLTPSGIAMGGSGGTEDHRAHLLKRRREMKELEDLRRGRQKEVQAAQTHLENLELEIGELDLYLEDLRRLRQDQDLRVVGTRKDLERMRGEIDNLVYAAQRSQREVQKVVDQIDALEVRGQEWLGSLQELRVKKEAMEGEVTELSDELNHSRLGFESLQLKVRDLQVNLATRSQEYQGVHKQWDMVTQSLGDLRQQFSRLSQDSDQTLREISENQTQLKEKQEDLERGLLNVERFRGDLSQARDLYERLAAEGRQLQEAVVQGQRQQNERQGKINELRLRYEQIRMREQNLIDQMRERYMINLDEVLEEKLKEEGTPERAETELVELRDKLAKIGEVNLSAIEEYRGALERYEFLSSQHQDLLGSKLELGKVIDRINSIVSHRFKETFDQVNERFQMVFPVLFGGGEASLELVEDVENAEYGIDITAKPPGKKMQNISLLSGGEKALTAVSLIFSIFLVKPSPYCLLDEVDAPLDDANVFRFNDLVREMSRWSQVILVTHNKHTMEVAGKLYGVTMQEKGVSTMVSVNLKGEFLHESVL